MKTLGICIPTYRRPALLERCIRSALESAGDRPIRIFVADDSVSDANVEVMERLCRAHEVVRWERHAVNLGIDRNIQFALGMNDCDHGWLIGEDDRFLPGAVARMHDRLQSIDDPFVFSNYQYVTEDHGRVLGTALPDTGPEAMPTDLFVATSLWATGFIGCCVVSREAWNRTDGRAYDGTYFTHVGRIVALLAGREQVPIVREPGVANRAQGDDTFTWKHDSFGVFLGFERMCGLAAARWPARAAALRGAVESYRDRMAYLSIKTTFRLRSEGAFDLRQWRSHIADLSIPRWKKAWLLALAATPSAALRPLARAYVAWQGRAKQDRPTIRRPSR